MKKIVFAAVAVFAVLSACQREELAHPMTEYDELNVTIEEMVQTKTYKDEDNRVLWSDDDRIVAFMYSTLSAQYKVKSGGKPTASFTKVSSDDLGGSKIDHVVTYYPYSDQIECEEVSRGYSMNVVLPAEQTYAPNSFGNGSLPMASVSADNNIAFCNVNGAMKLQLKGTAKVTSVKVEGKNNEKLSGAATVTVYTDGSKPSISMASGASTSVLLDCGDGVQLNKTTATELIISLPPITFTKGFIVTITDAAGSVYTIDTDKRNEVKRSSLLIMPEKTLVFEDEEQGPPQMYYGYIPKEILVKYEWGISKGFSAITEDWVKEALDKGTIIKTDLEKVGKVTFDEIPKNSFVFFALPSSSGLEVTQTLVLNNGGKFSFNGFNQGNGEHKLKIGGRTYDCYGTYQSYAQSNYICYVDTPKEPQLFYGYVSPEMMAKYNLSSSSSYDQITAECISACLDKGTLIRNDVATMSETSFGDVPANSMLVVGVAEKSIYAAFKSTSDADKNEFDGLLSSNGECTTSWYEEEYLLYGEYTSVALSKDNSPICFQISYRPSTEGKLPMYIGYIPYDSSKFTASQWVNDGYSLITEQMILDGVTNGNIVKTDAKKIEYDGCSFGTVPKQSLLLIALPQSSGFTAYCWNIIEQECDFTVNPSTNGATILIINNQNYQLYGERTPYDLVVNEEEIYYKIK